MLLCVSVTVSLTPYSMDQSPSGEANGFVASQEISRVLLNPKVYYRIHNCSPPVSILSQPNPVHTPTSHFLKIHPNIILPPTPGSIQWSLSLRFPHQNPIHASLFPHPLYMPHPTHFSRFYKPHNIGWGLQFMKLLVTVSLKKSHCQWAVRNGDENINLKSATVGDICNMRFALASSQFSI
jgi:hypothetical protein